MARPWRQEDLESAIQLWGDDKVLEFIDVRDKLTEREVYEKLRQQIQMQQEFEVSYWVLVLKETNEIIGCCGLRPHNLEGKGFELGFHIMAKHWGNGYALESAKGAINYAFRKLKANYLFAGHNPKNAASKKLLYKLGFKYQGDEYYAPTKLMHPSYILQYEDVIF